MFLSISAKNKITSKPTSSSTQVTGGGFQIYGDSSTPADVLQHATGQLKNNPLDPSLNRENVKQMQKLKGARVTSIFCYLMYKLTFFIKANANNI